MSGLYLQMGENSAFFFHEELELLFAVGSAFSDGPAHAFCVRLYGEEKIASLRGRYGFFCELFACLNANYRSGMAEALLDYPCDTFRLADYRAHVQAMERTEFIRVFLGCSEEAVPSIRGGADRFFADYPEVFSGLLGCHSFFGHTGRFIRDYFALCDELNTDGFRDAMLAAAPEVDAALEETRRGLAALDPLSFSQQRMGKVFHNRGPYAQFLFAPSVMLPFTVCRFFGRRQILFHALRPAPLRDDGAVAQLGAIADAKRFQILALLKQSGPLRGTDIAKRLSLAPSTVSHHMEQLRNAGLIHEEQVKTAKYYSIDQKAAGRLIQRLADLLGAADH